MNTFSVGHPRLDDSRRILVISDIHGNLAYLDGLGDKLLTLSVRLDSREMAAEEACAALRSEGATCAALHARLADAFPEELPASLRPLDETLLQAADTAEHTDNESSAARIGAALKYCHLTVFFGLSAFADGLR